MLANTFFAKKFLANQSNSIIISINPLLGSIIGRFVFTSSNTSTAFFDNNNERKSTANVADLDLPELQ